MSVCILALVISIQCNAVIRSVIIVSMENQQYVRSLLVVGVHVAVKNIKVFSVATDTQHYFPFYL